MGQQDPMHVAIPVSQPVQYPVSGQYPESGYGGPAGKVESPQVAQPVPAYGAAYSQPYMGEQQQQYQGQPQPVNAVPVYGTPYQQPYGQQPQYYGQPQAAMNVQAPGQPARHSNGCTIDWIFFALGWFIALFWLVGVLLPICRTPRFPNGSSKVGFGANCVMTILACVAIGIAVSQSNNAQNCENSYYGC